MAIANVIQRGTMLNIYDINNRITGTIYIMPNDQLMGYTGQSVNIKRGTVINTYDEKGRIISTNYVGL